MWVARGAGSWFADNGAKAVVFKPVPCRVAAAEEAWARLLGATGGGCPGVEESAEKDVAKHRGKELGDPVETVERSTGYSPDGIRGKLGGPPGEAVAKPVFKAIRLPVPEKFNRGLLKFASALLRIVLPDRPIDQL